MSFSNNNNLIFFLNKLKFVMLVNEIGKCDHRFGAVNFALVANNFIRAGTSVNTGVCLVIILLFLLWYRKKSSKKGGSFLFINLNVNKEREYKWMFFMVNIFKIGK